MNLDVDTVVEKAKGIPPIVWVIAAGVVLLILLMGKGGGGGAVAAEPQDESNMGGGGGGGGLSEPDLDQEVTNLFALIREDQAARAEWQSGIDALLKRGATPTPTAPTYQLQPIPRPASLGTRLPTKGLWGKDVGANIRALDPTGVKTAAKLKSSGHDYKTQINIVDLKAGLKKRGHDYKTTVDPVDVKVLLK